MVSKTLNEVIIAEKQSAEKVDLANNKSEQIINTAKVKAKEIIEKAKQDCKTETENLIEKNIIKINEILNNNDKASFNEASEIRANAQAKKEKAIDMVIEKIISK